MPPADGAGPPQARSGPPLSTFVILSIDSLSLDDMPPQLATIFCDASMPGVAITTSCTLPTVETVAPTSIARSRSIWPSSTSAALSCR